MTTVSRSLLPRLSAVFALLFSTLPACGFGSGDPQGVVDLPPDPTWVDGISELMSAYCDNCHGPHPSDRSLAYFRTDTYGREGGAQGAFDMRVRLLARIEDSGFPMPPAPARPLSPDEVQALQDWVSRGAPYDASGSSRARSGAPSCDAGTITACGCLDGSFGQQVCRMDGMYAPCECGGTGGSALPNPGTNPDGSGGGGNPGGGDAGGNGGGNDPGLPTLTAVWSSVFVPSCAAVGCHIPGGAYPDLQSQSGLADRLLQPSHQERGMALVEPGFLDGSYLYAKVRDDFSSLRLGAGTRMPPALPLSDGQRALLQSWITAGAPP